jgi:hypothetical protein
MGEIYTTVGEAGSVRSANLIHQWQRRADAWVRAQAMNVLLTGSLPNSALRQVTEAARSGRLHWM